jgi:hypothetical protein
MSWAMQSTGVVVCLGDDCMWVRVCNAVKSQDDLMLMLCSQYSRCM